MATKCERCKGAMRMLYPGNDPENGPARLYCETNETCRAFADEAEAHAEMAERDRVGRELIERLTLAVKTLHEKSILRPLLADAARWIEEAM